MRWFIATVLLCIAVFATGSRKALAASIALALAVLVWILITNSHRVTVPLPPPAVPSAANVPEVVLHATSKANAVAASPIAANQVRVEYLHFDLNYAGGISSVSGRLLNTSSDYTVGAVDYKLRIEDCKGVAVEAQGPPSGCAIVHEQSGSLNVTIPPAQGREVSLEVQHERRDTTPAVLAHPRVSLEIAAVRIN